MPQETKIYLSKEKNEKSNFSKPSYFFIRSYMVKYNMTNINTLFFYNITFYKNIHAEISEILRIFENKPQAEILKRIWFCVLFKFVNIIQQNYPKQVTKTALAERMFHAPTTFEQENFIRYNLLERKLDRKTRIFDLARKTIFSLKSVKILTSA